MRNKRTMRSKRVIAAAAAISLAAGAVSAAAATGETAAPFAVLVDGVAMPPTDAAPYEADGELFVPIRAVAERLGFSVTYEPETSSVRLNAPGTDVSLKIAAAAATVNGVETAFAPASALSGNRVFVPLSFFRQTLGLHAEYRPELRRAELSPAAAGPDAERLAADVLQLLVDGKFDQLHGEWFAPDMQAALPAAGLSAAWESVQLQAGNFVGLSSVESAPIDAELTQIAVSAQFERLTLLVTVVLNGDRQVAGLFMKPVAPDAAAPAAVVEEAVVVGAGTAYELGGTLTLPAAADGPVPAVVLVHGSGPSDRDEAAFAYKPFRDLAWGLAERGIAVLRYDKRTYTYGAQMTPEEVASITVAEETVLDAASASALLKRDPRIDASNVYVVGHSLGGMLAPRIDAEGGDFAGLILLGGSPRTLWEIIYDQNLASLAAMDDAHPAKQQQLALVEAEYEKARTLAAMSDEEAKISTVFGLPAYYLKEMDRFDVQAYVAGHASKPVLVLHGEDDFQLSVDADFAAYQRLFADRDNVEFKLYPGLNHFFVDYSGHGEGTLDEYVVPGTVSADVIADMAAWMLRQP